MKLWTDSQSQLAEHLSLLVVQPHSVVNFCLALVNKTTEETCCEGDVRQGMTLGPGICCLALCLLCPVGGLGLTPFWHVFVPATWLGFYSSCCTSAFPGEHCLGKAACWVDVGSQVRFVAPGTDHGFSARRAADPEQGW